MQRTPVRLFCLLALTGMPQALGDQWSEPAGFYDSVTGTGATLKSSLASRMALGHIQRSYGDFRFSAATFARDPNNSSNILLVYNRASVPATWDSGATWNREHVWPQSLQPGSVSNSSMGNLGDHHALRACNPSINSSRGNKPFGLGGTVGGFGSLGTYYFPGDEDKGDIARSLFYSDTRWGPSLGISLVNGVPGSNQMGDLASHIAWHYLDPPDEFERRRNHTIYSQAENPAYYTNNRNAYIDRPEYIWSVYVDQANDSMLFVDSPSGDGSSSTTVSVGPALVGAPGPIMGSMSLFRIGEDGVYYSVTTSGEAVSDDAGRHNAFPINTGGSATGTLSIGIDTATASIPGLKTGQIVIDNLDVTTGGGVDRGANDGDDIVTVELPVLDHAEASFSGASDVNSVTIDLGAIEHLGGDGNGDVEVFNLEQTLGFTAALDVEIDGGTGDTGVITLGPSSLLSIPAGSMGAFTATLDDATLGSFSATYTLRVFDDQTLVGATEGAALVVTLTGEVVAGLCPSDLNGDTIVDGADLGVLLGAWGAGPSPADLNGDGVVDGADLGLLLGSWGACE
ncbi:MAG: endonuclease [Phycisphaerales bacterium]